MELFKLSFDEVRKTICKCKSSKDLLDRASAIEVIKYPTIAGKDLFIGCITFKDGNTYVGESCVASGTKYDKEEYKKCAVRLAFKYVQHARIFSGD